MTNDISGALVFPNENLADFTVEPLDSECFDIFHKNCGSYMDFDFPDSTPITDVIKCAEHASICTGVPVEG